MSNLTKTLKLLSRFSSIKVHNRNLSASFVLLTNGKSDANMAEAQSNHSHHSTIDIDEVNLHANLKNQWWKKDGSMRGLHSLNNLRVPFVRDGLLETRNDLIINVDTPAPLKDAKILDVGCGGGILTESLAKLGGAVTGLDASEELITLAKEHGSSIDHLNYVHDSIELFSEKHSEEFDAVVASEVVEHVTNKDLFIESCVRALRPGGSLFITTLNKTNLAWLGGIMIAENLLRIVPNGTHQWDKFISPEELARILDKHNCKTRMIHGMFYSFLQNEWCWTSNTSINYAMQFVKKIN